MPSHLPLNILVAPLDWGLGHTTRCIPLIKHLISLQCRVFIAADGASKQLLALEFPQCDFLYLRGYGVHYSKKKRFLPLKILSQLPKILKAISYEHQWLLRTVQQYKIDAVIADNRYGLWHPTIPSVFITHQLLIKGQFKWLEWLMQQVNYKHINRFGRCWVPDEAGTANIAGALSHPRQLPSTPVQYIGGLSRFQLNATAQPTIDLLVLLSGPEPQRTLFEQLVLNDLEHFAGNALLLRGLPQATVPLPDRHNVVIQNHLPASGLQAVISQSKMIICRPGYTTVMDVLALQKQTIMVPTPGQTEQEYLAQHLQQQGVAVAISQDQFQLKAALQQAKQFTYQLPLYNMQQYKPVLEQFINTLKS